jgi:hypothetical protein
MKSRTSRRAKSPARKGAVPTVSLRYCAVRRPPPPRFPPSMDLHRRRVLLQTRDKWDNGKPIRYWFFDKPKGWAGDKAQKDVVREAFAAWKQLGVGLEFEEVKDRAKADVRIAFLLDDGSWSYVGTDVRTKRQDPRTMNFGWSLTDDPPEGRDTALHEIGHTLGLPHEHQNPFAGLVWDEEAVYAALAKPPNRWKRATTYSNIIEKLEADGVQGSSWDPDSIMHYPFEAGLILKPAAYAGGLTPAGGLSKRDREWVLKFYPPVNAATLPFLPPLQSVPLTLESGQQASFAFQPSETRAYEFRTFGASDTELALYGTDAATPLAQDDDSGEGRNAYLKVPLKAGKRYTVHVRMRYASPNGESAVMGW